MHDPSEPVPEPSRQGKRGRDGGRRRKTARATARAATGPERTTPSMVKAQHRREMVAGRSGTPQRDRPDAGNTGQRGTASERCRGLRTSGEAPGRACVRVARRQLEERRRRLYGHERVGRAGDAGRPVVTRDESRGPVADRDAEAHAAAKDAAAARQGEE